MAYVALTDTETNAGKPIRQALKKKIRDNFIDHESRIVKVENESRLFEHFNFADSGTPITVPTNFTVLGNTGDGDISYPAFSVIRLNHSSGAGIIVQSKRNFRFDAVTLPIKLIVRAKKLVDVAFFIGMRPYYSGLLNPGLTDGNGIWLERVDASNWRFVSYNGSRNNGSNFTKPTDGNWFEVEIEFTNTPSNQALCRVDGVLKETLTTQLPTTTILHGNFHSAGSGSTPGTNVMDVDRFDYSVTSQINAA